jgi:hypothetical protein
VGLGDNLLGSGIARGAKARGKRIAFGDGQKIRWDQHSPTIFRGNPNVAEPGQVGAGDLEWVAHHKGQRLYNRLGDGRWVWNYDFKAQPGEVFFDPGEKAFAQRMSPGFVLIEPNVPWHKSVAPNKDWGFERYQAVADRLRADGVRVCQFVAGKGRTLDGVEKVATPTFRLALAGLSRAALYVGPEGGLHHGAAAVGVSAVVLFGGFIPPQVTGYDTHTNLTGGAEACGSLAPCDHCKQAMSAISVEEVYLSACQRLGAAHG